MNSLNPRSLRRGAFAILGGISAAGLAVTSAQADHPAGTGGTLNYALNSPHVGFDTAQRPIIRIYGQSIMRSAYEDLFGQDDKGKLVPILGLSLTSSDDFKVWQVKLRKGVSFSNGEPFTAETYVVGIQRYLASKQKDFILGRMAPFETAVALDDHTVEFRMTQAFPGFKELVSTPNELMWFNAPKHSQKVGKDLLRQPVGTGPYMLADWRPGGTLTFVRNPNYWNPKNRHFDKVVYKIIREETAQYNTMITGGVDIYMTRLPHGVNRARTAKGVNIIKNFAGGTNVVAFNHRLPMFQDIRVRRALAHAIDRDAMNKTAIGGLAVNAIDFWGPNSKFHCKTKGYPEYNFEKAKQLLKEYGKPLPKIKITIQNRGSRRVQGLVTQTFWRRLGLDVEVEALPRGTLSRRFRRGQFQVAVFGVTARTDPSRAGRLLHSKHKGNALHVNNPKIDAALEAADKVTDPSKRIAAYCKYAQVVIDELPMLLNYHSPLFFVHRDKLKGIKVTANNILNFQHGWFEK